MIMLPWPPSNNSYYRRVGSKTLISAKGRAYKVEVAKCCAALGIAKELGRLRVVISVNPPDRRRRDLDNLFKGLLDALTHGGAWADDSQIDDLRIVRGEQMAGGAVHVQIKSLGSDA